MKISGIYLKDGWVLRLADKALKITADILIFAFIVALISLSLYFGLTWLVESGVV